MSLVERIQIGHLIKVLEAIYIHQKQDIEPTVADIISYTKMSTATLYNVRHRLKEEGFIEERINPDRTVTIKLTEKGIQLAECLLKCKPILYKK